MSGSSGGTAGIGAAGVAALPVGDWATIAAAETRGRKVPASVGARIF